MQFLVTQTSPSKKFITSHGASRVSSSVSRSVAHEQKMWGSRGQKKKSVDIPSIYVIKRPPTKSTATRVKAHHELEETQKNSTAAREQGTIAKCFAHKYCFNSHGTDGSSFLYIFMLHQPRCDFSHLTSSHLPTLWPIVAFFCSTSQWQNCLRKARSKSRSDFEGFCGQAFSWG